MIRIACPGSPPAWTPETAQDAVLSPGAAGPVRSIYLRDPNDDLIEVAEYL